MIKTKDPDSYLDYLMNWAPWLGDDEILTSTWTIPAGLVDEGESNTTTTATVWLSGGIAGDSYTVANKITTAGGRTEERYFTIKAKQKAA